MGSGDAIDLLRPVCSLRTRRAIGQPGEHTATPRGHGRERMMQAPRPRSGLPLYFQ